MKLTRLDYCRFLLTSPFNYTQTYFADHVEGLSHDKVNRIMREIEVTAENLWEEVEGEIIQSPNAYLLFDDTVLNKQHSFKIECVQKQWSGNEHKTIKGIGIVTCVYVNPDTNQFWAVDYRIFNPGEDGKTKIDHVSEMLSTAKNDKKLDFGTVLMDCWYAVQALMKQVEEMGLFYYTVIKKNRLVDESQGLQLYQKVEKLPWTEEELQTGKRIRLQNFPVEHKLQLFRITALPERTEFVVTNDLSQNNTQNVRKTCKIRWKIEEFHRELKQLTGIEACQCRKAIIQKNHIGLAMLAWAKLKKLACQTGRNVYDLWKSQYDTFVTHLLKQPSLAIA